MIAILDTGAYGSCMASNYNLRGRAAELLVDGDNYVTVAVREELARESNTDTRN